MRAVAILVIGIGLLAVTGCNSEATVCPNPAACDQTPADAGPDGDAPAEVADAGADAD